MSAATTQLRRAAGERERARLALERAKGALRYWASELAEDGTSARLQGALRESVEDVRAATVALKDADRDLERARRGS